MSQACIPNLKKQNQKLSKRHSIYMYYKAPSQTAGLHTLEVGESFTMISTLIWDAHKINLSWTFLDFLRF